MEFSAKHDVDSATLQYSVSDLAPHFPPRKITRSPCIARLQENKPKCQNPLHQFPHSKSVTSWRLPRCVTNKSAT